jgi:hypothetical protein
LAPAAVSRATSTIASPRDLNSGDSLSIIGRNRTQTNVTAQLDFSHKRDAGNKS